MKYFVSFSYRNDDGPITQRDAVFECVGEIDIEKLRYSLMEKNNASTLSIHNYIPINKPDSGLTHTEVIKRFADFTNLGSEKEIPTCIIHDEFVVNQYDVLKYFTDIEKAIEYLEDL